MEAGSSAVGANQQPKSSEKPQSAVKTTESQSQSRTQRKKAMRLHLEQLARDLHLTGERMSVWNLLPINLLIQVMKLLSLPDRGRCGLICKRWYEAYHMPDLWHSFVFEFMQMSAMVSTSTPDKLIEQVFERHSGDLRHVVLKVDSHQQSVQQACNVLVKLGDCSLHSLQLVTVEGPSFTLFEPTKVVTALSRIVSSSTLKILAVEETLIDDALLEKLASKSQATLVCLRINGCRSLSAAGVSSCLCSCNHLSELSMDYVHLSDKLCQSLCTPPHVAMKSLNINVGNPDSPGCLEDTPWPSISSSSWALMMEHYPNLSFTMQFRFLSEEQYDPFFNCNVPVTVLHFQWPVPVPVLRRISGHCPRLQELMVSSSGEEPINEVLAEIAGGCKELRTLELGSCVINSTAVVQLAKLCGPRLRTLIIPEEVVIEDEGFDLPTMSERVSHYLQKPWDVVFMPTWFE